jgi:predicted glycosyltransferase
VTKRVLFHVQHLLGIGHLKRAEILASAMAADGFDVTIAYGGQPLAEVPFRGVRLATLPPATIGDENFSSLLDGAGRPVGEAWKRQRRDGLLDLYHSVRPEILLIELFPFGRRQFRFELLPLLEAVHATRPRPLVACSVRDILVTPRKPGRAEEAVETLRRHFDAVLVHGDPAVIPFDATFPLAGLIADVLHYTGYVSDAAAGAEAEGAGEIIVSAGGGAVGAPLLFTAMEARQLTPLAGHVWRFLAGPNLPEQTFRRLAESDGRDVIVERFRTDFASKLRGAALSISQGGYNTIMDILQSGVRAIVIPYETAGETEQRLRAEHLAAKGLLTLVPAADLSPERLAKAVRAALAAPQSSPEIDLSGAATTARLLRRLSDRLAPP